MDDGPAVRRIALVLLVALLATGLWVGSRGDPPVRLLTAALFGLSALCLAWKLWFSRGERRPVVADPPPAPPPAPDAGPEPDEAPPSGPWKVYGYDRFSYEDYFVGSFDTREEAEAVVRERLEHLAKFQDESLRDRIWVEPPGSRYRLSLDD